MANIHFGVNLIPKADNTYTMGNSDYKWQVYVNSINGKSASDALLPAVSSTDNGKVLQVSNGAWSIGTASSGLPSVSSTDNGKVLGVSSGAWAAVDAPSGLPSVSSTDNGKVLKVASGDWSVEDEQDISGLAPKASPVFTGSISLGRKAGTTVGTNSFAVGIDVTASGPYSHAEGNATTASGTFSHAEGQNSIASGMYAHAEGNSATASGAKSHAEGERTTASGTCSHAEGNYTTAQRQSQHVSGEYNVLDSSGTTTSRGAYAEIIGNGTGTSARSNARTLDWSGNERLMGDIYVGCNADSTGGTKLEPLPTVTNSDNGKSLEVSNGEWAVGNEKINVKYTSSLDGSLSAKVWTGLTSFDGKYVWTDGENIYYSDSSNQYVLNKSTSTWLVKEWTGLTSFSAEKIWTDGNNIYYSDSSSQYVLDKSTSTWSTKTWTGLTSFNGKYVWTDGENVYYSMYSNQYVLDKTNSSWSTKSWKNFSNIDGSFIWTDRENIYYSNGDTYVLDKTTSTWSTKTWTGLTNFSGSCIWTDGDNIYYSNGTSQYILDKTTSTWSSITWTGGRPTSGSFVWTDGDYYYYSSGSSQYVFGTYYRDKIILGKNGQFAAANPSDIVMTGADGINAGASGLVPAPAATDNTKYLKGDGTWAVPTNTTYSTFVQSGSSAASGLVPAPSSTAGTTAFLCEDGTWKVPTDTTYSTFVGSGSSAAAGLVPAPGSTAGTSKFLCENGTWAVPTDTTYSVMTGATSSVAGTSGLVPAPTTGDVDKFLAGDGTYKSGGLPMVILKYGISTWADFEAAYKNNVIVYCRASSNSNPATGTQGRMAFMAYTNDGTNPTEVEFQYYRSVATHKNTQMGDEVYVYKLNKTSGWSVTKRLASIQSITGTGITVGYTANTNVITLTNGVTVSDSLTDTSTTAALSAAKGKALQDTIGSTTMGTTATTLTGAIAEHESDITSLNSQITNIAQISGNGVDVNSCSTLLALFDAIDASTNKIGYGGTGNQQTTNLKTLLGGTGLSNYDTVTITRLSENVYLAIACSAVTALTKSKMKILARGSNARTDPNRFTQTAWFTIE